MAQFAYDCPAVPVPVRTLKTIHSRLVIIWKKNHNAKSCTNGYFLNFFAVTSKNMRYAATRLKKFFYACGQQAVKAVQFFCCVTKFFFTSGLCGWSAFGHYFILCGSTASIPPQYRLKLIDNGCVIFLLPYIYTLHAICES